VRARPGLINSRAAGTAALALFLIAVGLIGIKFSENAPSVGPVVQLTIESAPKPPKAIEPRSPVVPVRTDETVEVRKLIDARRFKEAAELLDSRLSKSPDDVEARISAAWVRLELGDPETAQIHARSAVALAPERSEGYTALGQALFRAKRYQEAALALSKTVEISPAYLESRLSYAEALTRAGEADAAERQYALCATQAPKNTMALQGYGAALARKGDLGGAVREYKKSLDLESGDVRTHLLIAELLSTLQRDEEAVYYFTKAESLASTEEDRSAAKEGLARLKQH
jgi:tetratricopeptide (TPR) repeat protein